MTHTLPDTAVELLKGKNHAEHIVEAMAVAYWMHGRDDHTAQYHLASIHEEFASLADALGYTVALKPAPAQSCAHPFCGDECGTEPAPAVDAAERVTA